MNLLWNFFAYSAAGWCLEVIFSSIYRHRYVNKGFLFGPVCPIYGISAVIISILFHDLKGHPFFLFIACMIAATLIELIAGHLLSAIFHQKWWDYSGRKFNMDGYICLEFSLFWGGFGVLMVMVLNPLFRRLMARVPGVLSLAALIGVSVLFLCDLAGTLAVLLKIRRSNRLGGINRGLVSLASGLRSAIINLVEHHVNKAYPQVDTRKPVEKRQKQPAFAEGNSFYKLILLFTIMAVAGAAVETVFIWFKYGRIANRSSLVFGQFSVVWGLAVVIMNLLLYRYRERSALHLFLAGTVLGGTYEYVCSVVTELLFGTIFWDYSKLPMNLGGRINLLYCFVWGAVTVTWMKLAYPLLSRMIERIPQKFGVAACRLLVVFLLADIILSSGALVRYHERKNGQEALTFVGAKLDEWFPDEFMAGRYPFAKMR